MALIDLSRQARAAIVGGRVLRTTSVTSSETGLYDVAWEVLAITDLGTGSIDIGSESEFVGKNLYLNDAVETTGGGNIYSTGSYGSNLVLQINPLGHPTGSVKIWGDLIVEGTSSVFNQATISIEDPIIDLNFTGSTALGSTDSGIRVGRSGGTNAQLVFDHSETRWSIDNADGSNINIVGSSTTDTLTNKTITSLASSTMGSNADLTFSGGGEVLGLPSTPSANDAATSKTYVVDFTSYLRKQFVKKSASITVPSTASFTAVSASAPAGFTSTIEDDFLFFINGQYMEHDALTIRQEGSSFMLFVNTGSIGYDLEVDDEILAWGKFNA